MSAISCIRRSGITAIGRNWQAGKYTITRWLKLFMRAVSLHGKEHWKCLSNRERVCYCSTRSTIRAPEFCSYESICSWEFFSGLWLGILLRWPKSRPSIDLASTFIPVRRYGFWGCTTQPSCAPRWEIAFLGIEPRAMQMWMKYRSLSHHDILCDPFEMRLDENIDRSDATEPWDSAQRNVEQLE